MNQVNNMQGILDQLYGQMLPLYSTFIAVSRALAGFLALWFIAGRVWGHIARAEAVDVYPLLRPFALGLAILMYPSLIALLNGLLQPLVTATGVMVQDSNQSIAVLLQQREGAMQQGQTWPGYAGGGTEDKAEWYQYAHPDDGSSGASGSGGSGLAGGAAGSLSDDIQFQVSKTNLDFTNFLMEGLAGILELLYEGASLVIMAIRTFILLILAIMGPLVIGLSVFDGFRHSFQQWLARYINVFLWLPVANIYGSVMGKIQELMLTSFTAGGTAYILFLLMGIVGYTCVPGTANYIVQAAGGHPLLSKINRAVSTITKTF